MLNLVTQAGHATRREFLKIGALGLGGLTLPGLLAGRALAAAAGQPVKDKSVVLLFLSGGASHIETFNPNMDAPAAARSMTGAVQTSLPGVSFGGTFPLLSRHADKIAVVRSFRHPIGDHVKAIEHVLCGGNPTAASMGSIYACLRGTNHPTTGIPTYSLQLGPEVDPQYRSERARIVKGSEPGDLGAAYAPFDPSGGSAILKNMQLNIARDRFDDRRQLLSALDAMKRQVDSNDGLAGVDKFTEQAYDLILGGASEAFDLKRESPSLREKYDTGMFDVGFKSFRKSTLGDQMLMARRLVEAGCGFVTVHSAGWDMHADGNNPGIEKGMEMLGRPVDKAVSAFLEDLESRGLSDKVLLLITGDFGRTPKINARGGRDHWTNLCTLALAGGGLNMGQVIGQSAKGNDIPASDPITTQDLMSTVLHTLFDIGSLRLVRGVPRELMALVENGKPIEGLF